MMKRYLSLWFPYWPLERLRRSLRAGPPADHPFALIEAGLHGLVLAAVNTAAAAQGLQAGLKFTDAKARVPTLVTAERDRAADAAALHQLADWLARVSPRVALDGEDGVMVETTGCDHLHGGEAAMLAALSPRLLAAGYSHRLALAGTPGAAFALARTAAREAAPVILASGDERAGLADLPVASLRLSAEAATLLRRFGLTRIGQLYGLDRAALARRFQSRETGARVRLRLDQALGLMAEPLVPLRPAPEQVFYLQCPDPVADLAGLTEGLRQLSETLAADLSQFGAGARGFRLTAFRSDGAVSAADVSAARPVRAAAHVQRLFREKLQHIDPGLGIDLLSLEAFRLGAMDLRAAALPGEVGGAALDENALAALADRLTARLGTGVTRIPWPAARHLPEAAETCTVYVGRLAPVAAVNAQAGPRPQRLFSRPERVDVLAEVPDGPPLRFVWRRVVRTAVRADGPERISPEWWRHVAAPQTETPAPACAEAGRLRRLPRARDYYRVEDSAGRRYWVFREGLYDDGRGGSPEWYVHGLFA
jgi:protein ImuB